MAGMRKRRKKKRKPDVQNISAFVEEAANEVFVMPTHRTSPALPTCIELWDRVCIAAVLSEKASENCH